MPSFTLVVGCACPAVTRIKRAPRAAARCTASTSCSSSSSRRSDVRIGEIRIGGDHRHAHAGGTRSACERLCRAQGPFRYERMLRSMASRPSSAPMPRPFSDAHFSGGDLGKKGNRQAAQFHCKALIRLRMCSRVCCRPCRGRAWAAARRKANPGNRSRLRVRTIAGKSISPCPGGRRLLSPRWTWNSFPAAMACRYGLGPGGFFDIHMEGIEQETYSRMVQLLEKIQSSLRRY